MITELRLENWKSFEQATLFIDPLSILIGTNASGKSNILDALLFLQRTALGSSLKTALQGDRMLSSIRGGLEWATYKSQKKNNIFTLSISVQKESKLSYVYKLSCQVNDNNCHILTESLIKIKDKEKILLFDTTPFFEGISEMLFTVYDGQTKVQNGNLITPSDHTALSLYLRISWEHSDTTEVHTPLETAATLVVEALKNIFILAPNPENMIAYSPLSNQLHPDASNIAGVLANLPEKRQVEIENKLTEYTQRLPERDMHRIYAEKIGKLGQDAMLYCDERWGDSNELFTVDARAMSDGTLRFLAILTALLTLPKGSLLAIDEVDTGLHPSRAGLLLDALQTLGQEREIDVLVTTHNSALLDSLGTKFVPFISIAHRDTISGASKLTLLEDIEHLPKLLAQGTTGKLSTQGLLEQALRKQDG